MIGIPVYFTARVAVKSANDSATIHGKGTLMQFVYNGEDTLAVVYDLFGNFFTCHLHEIEDVGYRDRIKRENSEAADGKQ